MKELLYHLISTVVAAYRGVKGLTGSRRRMTQADTLSWIVARTRPGRENWAAENIQRQGSNFYLPRISEQVKVKVADKRKIAVERTRCLFPNYIFVPIINDRWRFLLNTFGITGVVLMGQTPAQVPIAIINDLRSREVDGLVNLPARQSRFKAGDRVRVNGGVFTGSVGIYDGTNAKDCLRVLLDFLGRKTSVLIGEEYLEKEAA